MTLYKFKVFVNHKITLQNILVHHSWLVEQSSLPYPECWIPVNLQAQLKTHLFSTWLDFILSLKKHFIIYSFPC